RWGHMHPVLKYDGPSMCAPPTGGNPGRLVARRQRFWPPCGAGIDAPGRNVRRFTEIPSTRHLEHGPRDISPLRHLARTLRDISHHGTSLEGLATFFFTPRSRNIN